MEVEYDFSPEKLIKIELALWIFVEVSGFELTNKAAKQALCRAVI
jgi:hypothetical protein